MLRTEAPRPAYHGLADVCRGILALEGRAMPERYVEPSKVCRLCGEEKPSSEFRERRRVCNPCDVVDQRMRRRARAVAA